jgi:hypothetical protein
MDRAAFLRLLGPMKDLLEVGRGLACQVCVVELSASGIVCHAHAHDTNAAAADINTRAYNGVSTAYVLKSRLTLRSRRPCCPATVLPRLVSAIWTCTTSMRRTSSLPHLLSLELAPIWTAMTGSMTQPRTLRGPHPLFHYRPCYFVS